MAHVHSSLSDLPSSLMTKDGSRAFTAPIQGVDPVAADDLATKQYVDSAANSDAEKLQGVDISADTPNDGDLLVYDAASGEWQPKTLAEVAAAVGAGIGSGFFRLPELDHWNSGTLGGLAIAIGAADGNPRKLTDTGSGGVVTRNARCEVPVPQSYVPGTALRIRMRCLMSDLAQVSATLDCEVYHSHEAKSDGATLTDLISASPTDVNVGTYWRDLDFAFSSVTGIAPGDLLVLEITLAVDDTAGGGWTFDTTGGWLIVGDYDSWVVGQKSLVGSFTIG